MAEWSTVAGGIIGGVFGNGVMQCALRKPLLEISSKHMINIALTVASSWAHLEIRDRVCKSESKNYMWQACGISLTTFGFFTIALASTARRFTDYLGTPNEAVSLFWTSAATAIWSSIFIDQIVKTKN